jgi:hypothetical protein
MFEANSFAPLYPLFLIISVAGILRRLMTAHFILSYLSHEAWFFEWNMRMHKITDT